MVLLGLLEHPAGGGYAYAHSVFKLIDRASTAMADGSAIGDTNGGSL